MFLGLAAQVLSDRCERSDGASSGVPVDERSPDGVFEGGQLGVQVRWDAAEGLGGLVDAWLVGEGDEAFETLPGARAAQRVAQRLWELGGVTTAGGVPIESVLVRTGMPWGVRETLRTRVASPVRTATACAESRAAHKGAGEHKGGRGTSRARGGTRRRPSTSVSSRGYRLSWVSAHDRSGSTWRSRTAPGRASSTASCGRAVVRRA